MPWTFARNGRLIKNKGEDGIITIPAPPFLVFPNKVNQVSGDRLLLVTVETVAGPLDRDQLGMGVHGDRPLRIVDRDIGVTGAVKDQHRALVLIDRPHQVIAREILDVFPAQGHPHQVEYCGKGLPWE